MGNGVRDLPRAPTLRVGAGLSGGHLDEPRGVDGDREIEGINVLGVGHIGVGPRDVNPAGHALQTQVGIDVIFTATQALHTGKLIQLRFLEKMTL